MYMTQPVKNLHQEKNFGALFRVCQLMKLFNFLFVHSGNPRGLILMEDPLTNFK